MAKPLVVQTSAPGASSVSRNITERFLDAWRAKHADGRVFERDVAATPLAFASAEWLQAHFTPPDAQSAETRSTLALWDELVAEQLDADRIAISTPVYSYNAPAALKAWIDHIVLKELTLGFDGSGLATAKKATVVLVSGGIAHGEPRYRRAAPSADPERHRRRRRGAGRRRRSQGRRHGRNEDGGLRQAPAARDRGGRDPVKRVGEGGTPSCAARLQGRPSGEVTAYRGGAGDRERRRKAERRGGAQARRERRRGPARDGRAKRRSVRGGSRARRRGDQGGRGRHTPRRRGRAQRPRSGREAWREVARLDGERGYETYRASTSKAVGPHGKTAKDPLSMQCLYHRPLSSPVRR